MRCRRSEPPLRAMTARRKTGVFASGTGPPYPGSGSPICDRVRAGTIPPAAGQVYGSNGVARPGVARATRRRSGTEAGSVVPARCSAAHRRAPARPASSFGRGRGSGFVAAVRDVDHDRVRPAQQRGPELLGGLVVEHPLPPAAGHVLGDQDERDRLRPCPRATSGRGRRGRRRAARSARDTATRRRRAARPARPAAQRSRTSSPFAGSSET